VNDELAGIEAFLPAAVAALVPGGRLATIAFHSLEDRAVKQAFRRWSAEGAVTLVTRRPVRPGDAERARNARSRSARLRVVEKAV
jgi:16S rRNA (cytosine1402-N4)-methyltransferase